MIACRQGDPTRLAEGVQQKNRIGQGYRYRLGYRWSIYVVPFIETFPRAVNCLASGLCWRHIGRARRDLPPTIRELYRAPGFLATSADCSAQPEFARLDWFTLSPSRMVWNLLRNAIPGQECRHFVSVSRGQCIQPVDARDNISGFKLVESARRQLKFRIAEFPGERDARLMNVAEGQT